MEKTATLKVTGMSCGHCVKAVTEALEAVDGVRSAEVDLTAGRAVVAYDASLAAPERLAEAVEEEGSRAEVVAA